MSIITFYHILPAASHLCSTQCTFKCTWHHFRKVCQMYAQPCPPIRQLFWPHLQPPFAGLKHSKKLRAAAFWPSSVWGRQDYRKMCTDSPANKELRRLAFESISFVDLSALPLPMGSLWLEHLACQVTLKLPTCKFRKKHKATFWWWMVHLHPPYQNVYYIAKLYCKTSASYVSLTSSTWVWCCPHRHECIFQKPQGIWHFGGSSSISLCALQDACTTQLLGYPSQICLSVGEWTFEAQPGWRQVQDKLKPIIHDEVFAIPPSEKEKCPRPCQRKQMKTRTTSHRTTLGTRPSSSVQQLAAPCSVAKSRANWRPTFWHVIKSDVSLNFLDLHVTLEITQNPCRSGLFRHSCEEMAQRAEGSTLSLSDGFWRDWNALGQSWTSAICLSVPSM